MRENRVKLADIFNGRLDAYYYRDEFETIKNNLCNNCELLTLAQIGQVFDGPFGSNLKNDEYVENGIPLLRVQNVKNGKLALENCVYITEEKHNQLLRSEVKPDDVVITKTGWLGNAAVIPPNVKKANIRADLAGVRIFNKDIMPEYLAIFIDSKIGKTLCAQLNSGSTRERIVIENMRKLFIPKLDLDKQKLIIQTMQKAYENKKNKEDEAQKLIDSLDEFMLDELGIKLPKIEQQKDFKVNASSLFNSRFDSCYHQPYFASLKKELKNASKAKVVFLKSIIEDKFIKGYLPKDKEKFGNNKYIQITNISKDGTIDTLNPLSAADVFGDSQKLKFEDIIVVITGATIGKIAFWQFSDEEYFLGGDLIKFSIKQNINPYYIYLYLKSPMGQIQIKQNITGATNGHLAPGDVGDFIVLLPKKEIQDKIAKEYKTRFDKAKKLQIEAQKDFERAKEQVEKIILGEVD